MIKWYFPDPRFVNREDRIRFAGLIASEVPFYGRATLEEQRKRGNDPRMFNYHLLMIETSDHEETKRKLAKLQLDFIEKSKELSKLKKAKK